MRRSANITRQSRFGLEELRKQLAAPAWRLWTALARSDVMADTENRDQMLERHKIIVSLIEVNSQQLRCDSIAAGLDIERLCAVRELERPGGAPGARDALAAIDKRIREIEERKKKLKLEREWLEQSLSEIDQKFPASSGPIKHQ